MTGEAASGCAGGGQLLSVWVAAPPHPVVVVLYDGRVGEEWGVIEAAPGWYGMTRRIRFTGCAGQQLIRELLGTGYWRRHEEILSYFGNIELIDPGPRARATMAAQPQLHPLPPRRLPHVGRRSGPEAMTAAGSRQTGRSPAGHASAAMPTATTLPDSAAATVRTP